MVDHYCIKATVFSTSDGNAVNNQVQSNIAYVPYVPGEGFRMGFVATNPFRETIPLELKVTNTLPKGWNVRIIEQINGILIKPGELKRAHIIIDMPKKADAKLEAPFNGKIKGNLINSANAPFTGVLFDANIQNSGFTAQISINTTDGRHMTGRLKGSLNTTTGKFNGELETIDGVKKNLDY